MAFWGIEIKPGKPIIHSFDKVRRRLRISQATLGIGSAVKKTLVQCNVGNKCPVFLCALLPDKTESCHLDLEFEEQDDVVFSVIGPRGVYLTGYYVSDNRHTVLGSDTETYGEDIANTETGESNCQTDEDKYEDSFINDDDDPEVIPPSPVSSDQDEMDIDKNKTKERKGRKLQRKRIQVIDSDDCSTSQESEDEDDFTLSAFRPKKDAKAAVSEVKDKSGQGTIETGDKTADCAASVWVSIVKPDDQMIHGEAERKILQDNVLVPSINGVKLEKEIESKEGLKGQAKDAKTPDDNFVSHSDDLVDDKSQGENGRIDNSANLLPHNEDKSEPAHVSKKMLKRKRKEQSHEVNEKALEEDKALRIEAENDSRVQEPPQADKDDQKPTIDGNLTGSSLSLTPPEAISGNEQTRKKRRKGGNKERSVSCNDGTCNTIHVEDHFMQQVLEASKMNEDLPATMEEYRVPTVDRASDPTAEGCKLEKAKKKKKKSKAREIDANLNTNVSILSENENRKSPVKHEEMNTDSGTSQARTLSNGLTIEELASGDKNGKVATLGRKVKVFYTAKLKDSGHVFDSNVGKSPNKFRLGDDTVLEGWNVGLGGMRVGEKRRLVIPPSMGFGSQGAGENVPPNSWLVYEVELAGAR